MKGNKCHEVRHGESIEKIVKVNYCKHCNCSYHTHKRKSISDTMELWNGRVTTILNISYFLSATSLLDNL